MGGIQRIILILVVEILTMQIRWYMALDLKAFIYENEIPFNCYNGSVHIFL
jgi:hypothetical protein